MTAGQAVRHRVRLAQEFIGILRDGGPDAACLPPRISVFGLTSLPPAHLGLFAAIAQALDVHLFLLNPCQGILGNDPDDREIARRAVHEEPARLYSKAGTACSRPWGKRGGISWTHSRISTPPRTAGSRIPGGLSAPRRPVGPPESPEPWRGRPRFHGDRGGRPIGPGSFLPQRRTRDRGVARPAPCPLRVGAGAHASGCGGDDPDIDTYAPTIEAVFGTADRARRIPYHVAGRSARAASPLVRAFFDSSSSEGRFDVNASWPCSRSKRCGAGSPVAEATSTSSGTGCERRECGGEWTRRIGGLAACRRCGITRGAPASTGCSSGTHFPAAGCVSSPTSCHMTRSRRDGRRCGQTRDVRRGALSGGRRTQVPTIGVCLGGPAARARGGLSGSRRRRGGPARLPSRGDRGMEAHARQQSSRARSRSASSGRVSRASWRRMEPRPTGRWNRDVLRHAARRGIPFEVVCLVGMHDGAFRGSSGRRAST